MIIDGIAAAQTIDSSGEQIDIKGCDISTLDKTGVLNFEHRGSGDNREDSFNDIVGKCIFAKKIYSAKDCDDDRQKWYWSQVKLPIIYCRFRLFDDAGHPNAIAAAAAMRDAHRHGEPQILRFSIEGATLEREGNVIKKCIARRVALTSKPCNTAAISGVVEDPKSPEKPKDILAEIADDAKKFSGDGDQPLGGSVEIRCDPVIPDISQRLSELSNKIKKTLSAGMPTGAPSTRTGGAALQREDLSSKLRPRLHAALRDYDPASHGSFKKFLKSKLPEASDQFIDRFTDLVDELKIKKLAKKEGASPSQDPAPADTPEFKVKQPKDMKRGKVSFDENNGVLHTPVGSYKVYIPHNDAKYTKALQDPRVNDIHQKAMSSWIGLHRLAREGRLPHEVLAHAALFSAMSPNTSVPIQELAYGFMQDMQAKGFDPTKKLEGPELNHWAREWDSVVNGQMLPEYMRDHFAAPNSGAWTKGGRRRVIGLGGQKFQGATNYHQIHGALQDLFAKTKGNGREIAAFLNEAKHKAKLAANRGESPEGPQVKGFAPKTIRYLLGMAGVGSTVVPDTHFIRHTFGLPLGDARNEAIKSYLWDSKNEHALGALDRYYYKHHPAVRHTQEMFRNKFGEELGENVIFPAFWLHWLTVQPHERSRGWTNRAQNEDTDHAVYFNSVKRVLDKYGIPHDGKIKKYEPHTASMAARTAHAYKELHDLFGGPGASLAYYAYMVPALTGAHHYLRKVADLVDQIKLLKAGPIDTVRHFKGHRVQPGEIKVNVGPMAGQKMPLVFADDQHHYVLPPGANKPHKLPTAAAGTDFEVTRPHKILGSRGTVHASQHGIPYLSEHPQQVGLLDGIDMEADPIVAPQNAAEGMMTQGGARWLKSGTGAVGYVKPSSHPTENLDDYVDAHKEFSLAQREAAYHTLARDFFGLGQHVPVTAAFVHPITGEHHSVQAQVPGAEHAGSVLSRKHDPKHVVAMIRLSNSGQLDKLAMMDMLLGNSDRHSGNYMLTPDSSPHLHLIDNGFTFAGNDHHPPRIPHYWQLASALKHGDWVGSKDLSTQPLHQEAIEWIQKLDPEQYKRHLEKLGLPENLKNETTRRLMILKDRVKGGNVSKLDAFMAPFGNKEIPEW